MAGFVKANSSLDYLTWPSNICVPFPLAETFDSMERLENLPFTSGYVVREAWLREEWQGMACWDKTECKLQRAKAPIPKHLPFIPSGDRQGGGMFRRRLAATKFYQIWSPQSSSWTEQLPDAPSLCGSIANSAGSIALGETRLMTPHKLNCCGGFKTFYPWDRRSPNIDSCLCLRIGTMNENTDDFTDCGGWILR